MLDEAAGRASEDPEFWLELAELYSSYHQLHPDQSQSVKPKVVAALDRAAALKPQSLLLTQKLADGYKLMGEFSRAEPLYLELLDRFPALPGTREKLAVIYLRTARKDKAAEQLEAISRDNPRNEQAYYYLGNIASQEKRLSDAEDYFEQALTLKPEFEPVYYRLAEVKINLNKPKDALGLLDSARARFKRNFVLEFLTAVAYARLKEYAEAVRHFTEAEVIARAGEPDSLTYLFDFQSGSALEPQNAAFLDSMGWVLFKLKQPRDALGWLQKAVQHAKEPDPTLYDHLGDIYGDLRQFDKARDAWRKSLDLEPNVQIKQKLSATPGGAGPAE